MKIGIIGLPGTGKSTVFSALTGADISVHSFDANIANIKVPDKRLKHLREIHNPKKYTPAEIDFFDLPPFSDNEPKGELGDNILKHIRTADALMEVLDAFSTEFNETDIKDTVEMLDMELILTDLKVVENRIERLSKPNAKESFPGESKLLEKCRVELENNIPLRTIEFTEDEIKNLKGFQLLCLKPVVYLINVNERLISERDKIKEKFEDLAGKNSIIQIMSAQIEQELNELSDEDKEVFMLDLGIEEPSKSKVIKEAYYLLDLISFFTMGKDEVKAWTIKKGTPAQEAAGEIHSDIQRGFIRAEVVNYGDFNKYGSIIECKNNGVLRLEGKTYIVKDGDIINFRFNV